MEIKLSTGSYLIEFILIGDTKNVSILKVNDSCYELIALNIFKANSTEEDFWAFIAKNFSEKECEEIISYEIQLEEAFLESKEDIKKDVLNMQIDTCDRCSEPLDIFTCSWFNTDTICSKCAEIESKHSDYQKAKNADLEAVRNGYYNFEGIGLPNDFKAFSDSIRAKEMDV